MDENQLREEMKAFEDELPSDQKLEEWVKATGLSIDRVKEIYGEVIGEPDPWGRPKDYVDEHR